ncbi:hypothetical protein FB1_08030 [Flavobacterium branchiophilum NBRC 15030 = ATCC 35035]|nr:hypothetical protein FB1_08030 [Flavobacterium branchiophilum NBRC 15030 = ATCC 35035]
MVKCQKKKTLFYFIIFEKYLTAVFSQTDVGGMLPNTLLMLKLNVIEITQWDKEVTYI